MHTKIALLLISCFSLMKGCAMEPVGESVQPVLTAQTTTQSAAQTAATVSVHITAPPLSTQTAAVTTLSAAESAAATVSTTSAATTAILTHVTVTVSQQTTSAVSSTAAASVSTTSSAQSLTTASAKTTTAAPVAPEKTEDWMLMLANKTHPVGKYVPPELVTLKNNVKVDARMYPALQKMYDDMRAVGLSPITREGYRTYAQQQEIMQNRIKQHKNEGKTDKQAKALAEAYVAVPGTSEHQLGLAVDINSTNGQNQSVYNWLAKNAYKYGFIQRYPAGKEKITGYQAEAWHYRYVGVTAAKEMFSSGKTLEEYLGAV